MGPHTLPCHASCRGLHQVEGQRVVGEHDDEEEEVDHQVQQVGDQLQVEHVDALALPPPLAPHVVHGQPVPAPHACALHEQGQPYVSMATVIWHSAAGQAPAMLQLCGCQLCMHNLHLEHQLDAGRFATQARCKPCASKTI